MELHNPWWRGEPDPVYEAWKEKKIRWIPDEIKNLSLEFFSLNFLYGPRQVGKTTLIHLLIHELLKKHPPQAIFYCPCDEIVDFRELKEVITDYLRFADAHNVKGRFIFLDEITFVKEWWRAVKSLIDGGFLRNAVLTVSGSASIELLSQKEYFPGRRGKGTDVLLLPISFGKYASLFYRVHRGPIDDVEVNMNKNLYLRKDLQELFERYLQTGGFPLALENKELGMDSLWRYIKGDVERLGRSLKYFLEVASVILRSNCSPLSWNAIAKHTSLGSPSTAMSYVNLMERLFLVVVLQYFDGKRIHFRKEKKIHFLDPLIWHLFSSKTSVEVSKPCLVESVVASHLSRQGSVYYWRNGGEVDVIVGDLGVEVKWSLKRGRKPHFLKKFFSLDRESIPLFLASLYP